MQGNLLRGLVLAAGLLIVSVSARADYAGSILRESVKDSQELRSQPLKAEGYSPYAGKTFPTRVLWGDTHLHTAAKRSRPPTASVSGFPGRWTGWWSPTTLTRWARWMKSSPVTRTC